MYARSPSPSQRPAPTTIASRSPFPLGLCSCSTSLSKMGTKAAPRGRRALDELGKYQRHVLYLRRFIQHVKQKKTFRLKKLGEVTKHVRRNDFRRNGIRRNDHFSPTQVGGNRSKERDRKSELVLKSAYQIFEWDRNNSDRKFYKVVRYVHIPLVP